MTIDQLRDLLKEMSLQEKINQLVQVNSSFYEKEGLFTGPQDGSEFSNQQLEQAGSILGKMGASELIQFQNKYLETQPHKIPMLFMADIINGYKTVFPIPLAQGATFNPELSKQCAHVAAKESSASGLHVTFSPMTDLVKDPRWGRVMESTGEDAYLNSCFGRAMVEGYQGNDVSEKGRIAACVKHFAGYGAPLGGREYNQVELSPRSLREEYLPAYQAAIDAGVKLVMTSFNTLDRVPCTGNKHLLRNVLRKEMGFEGVLISDWGAIKELIPHGIAKDEYEAAKLAVEAGVDVDMMTDVYANYLEPLVNKKVVTQEFLDEAVYRILVLKNELGLFENPHKDADPNQEQVLLLCKEHRNLARKAAVESFVLLKNEEILPLSKQDKIAFIGPYVDEKNLMGSWTIFADSDHCVSIREGIKEKVQDGNITFCKGFSVLDANTRLPGFREKVTNELIPNDSKERLAALKLAAESKTVVVTLGEHPQQSGEGASRTDISLPQSQIDFLKELYHVNQNVVAVIFNGRPLDLREVTKYTKAILIAWFPGSEGGNAIADILFGDEKPSGKLPMSFPYNVGQVPVCYNEFNTGRPFNGDLDIRFASKYIDAPNKPLFSFGFGLSYTHFSYSKPVLNVDTITKDSSILLTISVKNMGLSEGVETIQLYIQDLSGSVVRPVRELKAFKKVLLQSHEEKYITFEITEKMLRFFTISMQYKSEPGQFMAYVGGNSETKNGIIFYLKE